MIAAVTDASSSAILVDTSAWVEYDRATGSAIDWRLRDLIGREGPVAVTEAIVMEVLAGARTDDREIDLRRMLLRFRLLPLEPSVDFEGAATIYRRCRGVGVTPRGLVDCLIASVAARTGASLLSADVDLARVADVIGLALDPASVRPS